MFSIERSGYYAWKNRKASKQSIANEDLDKRIIIIFDDHKSRYGSPRITDELHDQGEKCGKNRVFRRMKYLGLRAKGKKKFKVTTDSKHNLPVAANLLNRDFSATAPNQKWVSDITYIWTDEGWLYLATVIDLYSRAVIGWSIQPTMTRELVCDALMMALWRRGFPRGVLCHSDRGSQYCSNEYWKLINKHHLVCSMSKRGDCYDNAAMESWNHSFKVEAIHGEKLITRAEAKNHVFDYIEVYYNRKRLHSKLGYLSPENFEVKKVA